MFEQCARMMAEEGLTESGDDLKPGVPVSLETVQEPGTGRSPSPAIGDTSTELGNITLEPAVSEDDTDSAREENDNGETIEADNGCQDATSFDDANFFHAPEEEIPDSSPICEIGLYYFELVHCIVYNIKYLV